MATANKTAKPARKTASRRLAGKTARPAKARDAIALLRADHAEVSALFADYTNARTAARKQSLVKQIAAALTVHAQIEEEIFYPAVQQALKDKVLVPEATVEHASLKALIAALEDSAPGAALYDARVQVLAEYVKHHVNEEQTGMFPKAKASPKLDLAALGAQLQQRKDELLAQRKEGLLGKIKRGLQVIGELPPPAQALASV